MLPSTLPEAWRWGEKIYENMGVYRSAVERIVAFFITDIQIDGRDNDTKKRYTDLLHDKLHIRRLLTEVALDYIFYGNSILSPITPIRRVLICEGCRKIEIPLEAAQSQLDLGYSWSNFGFQMRCPSCKRFGSWKRHERVAGDGDPLIIKRWPLQDIDLQHDPYTGRNNYIWKLGATYREDIRKGSPLVLQNADWAAVDAVRHNQNVRLHDVFHMKETQLCGQDNRGWGLSKALTHFGLTYYVLMLHRYNEALALDYVIPWRVITPELKGGPVEAEPAFQLGMSNFMSRVNSMIRGRRQDPTKVHVMPWPIKYQALGGDATQFAPKDLLDQGYDLMLNAVGCPVELYKGNLGASANAPMMRLFETQHVDLVDQLNRCLNFILEAVAARMKWEPATGRITPPTHADNMEQQQVRLQLAMNKMISETTALAAFGIKREDEKRQQLDEQQKDMELQQEMQEDMDQQMAAKALFPAVGATTLAGQQQAAQQGQSGQPAQGGQPAAGAAPMPGQMPPMPPGGFKTIDEYTAYAQQAAQTLVYMDEGTRRSQLSSLRKQDSTLADLVVQNMQTTRNQMRSQGQQMMLAQGPPA